MKELINEILYYYFNQMNDLDEYYEAVSWLYDNMEKDTNAKEYFSNILIENFKCPTCCSTLSTKSYEILHEEVDTRQYEQQFYLECERCGWNESEEDD